MADDQEKIRRGLRALLATFKDISVVAEAADGLEAVRMAEGCHPDVVLMDVRMPGIEGIEATRRIKERWPDIAILMLTMHASTLYDSKSAGADAFLVKGCPTEELVATIRAIAGTTRDPPVRPPM
jgi:DNA-binding NarL/FixJ family response regulator